MSRVAKAAVVVPTGVTVSINDDKIVVKGQDSTGKTFRVAADGLLSRCFQHEIDHLDGKLFTDVAVNLHEQKPKGDDDEDDEDDDESEEE